MQTDLSTQARPKRTLSDRLAFLLLASVIIGFLAASSAPTPLYATYAKQWGFSPITTTVIFGVYALAVLAALLAGGRLSDHIGRRPVLLAALVAQVAAMVVFEVADGVSSLVLARVVQGLATGAAAGAIGAGLIDFDRNRGAIANALAAPIGTGIGAVLAGLVVQFLPAPTHLVFALLIFAFVLQTAGVFAMRETVARRPGAARSLLPKITVPAHARRAVLVATPGLVAAWALPSYYASLGPGLIRVLSGSSSQLLAALPLFLLAFGAVPVIVLLRSLAAERVMLIGSGSLIVGVALCLVAIAADSAVGFLAATLIAGAGFGGAFQGAVRTVMSLARDHERAGLLSLVYVVSYLALGVPAMIGGVVSVRTGRIVDTALGYGMVVMALAAVAALGLVRGATLAHEAGQEGGRLPQQGDAREDTERRRPQALTQPCHSDLGAGTNGPCIASGVANGVTFGHDSHRRPEAERGVRDAIRPGARRP